MRRRPTSRRELRRARVGVVRVYLDLHDHRIGPGLSPVGAGGGPAASAIVFGGFPNPGGGLVHTAVTEEYTTYAPKVQHIFGRLDVVSASIDGVSGYTTSYFPSGSTAFSGSVYGTMLSGSGELRNKLRTDGKRNTNKL